MAPALLKSRWFRLVCWSSTIFLTSVVYYGWQPWSLMLMRAGAFEWLCDPDLPPVDSNFKCDAQYDRVGSLYTIATSAEFVCGILAGVLFDNVGPRLTAVIGESLFIIGYSMIAFSGSTNLYVAGHICAGSAVNFVAYPAFILAEIWPSRSQTLIALILAVQVGATLIAPVMELAQASLGWSFGRIIGVYLVFTMPFILAYCTSLPRNRLALRAEIAAAKGGVHDPVTEKSRESGWSGYFRSMATVEFGGLLIWYTACIMMYNSYTVRLRAHAGDAVANFMGWALPSQAVVGVLIGLVNDKVLTLWIMLAITVFNALFLLIAFIPAEAAQYVSVVLYVVANSYIYTTKYTYVAEIYPAEHFGKLAGTVGFVSGWLQMFNILIDEMGAAYAELFIAWTAVTFALVGFLGWFLFRQLRQGISYKTLAVDAESGHESSTVAMTEMSSVTTLTSRFTCSS